MRAARFSILLLLAVGVAVPGASAAAGRAEIRHPEDLFIVDCLLPAKVRSLGRITKFAAPRKVVRVPAHECRLRHGEYSQNPEDNDFALQAWLAQAEGGDAEAMNNVGEIYEQGVRGAPNHAEAAKWYQRAAEAGSRRAQTNLGALYELGRGVDADAGAALAWYRKAAGLTSPVDLDAQREIDALRAELEKTRAEADSTRAELGQVAVDLGAARAGLAEAEQRVARLEQESTRARREAAAARRDAQAARDAQTAAATAAAPAGSPEPAPEIVAARRAVEDRQRRVAELEAAQDRYRRLLGELEAASRSSEQIASLRASDLVGKPPPSIHFVRPDVLATRGPALAPISDDAEEAEIVGRVEAPLGLSSLVADGRPVETAADGYFRIRVPARSGATVRFVAVDRASRRAEAEIRFVTGAERSSVPASPPAPTTAGRTARRSFALVVANGSYRSLPELRTARSDGEAVAEVLRTRYGFTTTLLTDATFLDTLKALSELGSHAGAEDDLLVYFAGHGRMQDGGRRGYWLPVDARSDDVSTWIPNEAIARLLGTFAAGRILVVSDSCYAGTLASSGLELAAAPSGKSSARSRLVITSGGLQPVLDEGGDGRHSIFARALLSVLQLADRPMSAAEVFAAVAARVSWKANRLGLDQTPQLAPIRWAGHEAGELVLAPKGV